MNDGNGNVPNLEGNFNLPPPRVDNHGLEPPIQLAPDSPISPTISCLSYEFNQDHNNNNFEYSNNLQALSLVVVGCPRCLMYAMVSEGDLKCPQCKSTDLIHFFDANNSRTLD